jgi:uncharacterized protein YgbK (DUF1537 family)
MGEADIRERPLAEVLGSYPPPRGEEAAELIAAALKTAAPRKIIVLDDDPTGVQTVHGVSVYTGWNAECIGAGFDEPGPLFFVLTNSRGMNAEESGAVHREIGGTIARTARAKGRDFIIISRSDSTLRGHYPLETEALRQSVKAETGRDYDGEIICPFFIEGGRYTAGNIHYVKTGDTLIPAARTEFAADKTFGYRHSDLTEWVEEKTGGAYPARQVTVVSLEDIRGGTGAVDRVAAILLKVRDFGKVIINALDYADVAVCCAALYRALDAGKRYLVRSAAAFPKVLGGIGDRPLLSREELLAGADREGSGSGGLPASGGLPTVGGLPASGGLIVIGSHVRKTSRQLELLLEKPGIRAIEFNTHLVLEEEAFAAEIRRVQELADQSLKEGKTTVIFTARRRFDLNTGSREDELKVSMKIAAAVTSFVAGLKDKPRFIIAKGGITSSEIGTAALNVTKALVLGQILPGIPVWLTGPESRFPHTPYIIFPGNVGEEGDLRTIADMLEVEHG